MVCRSFLNSRATYRCAVFTEMGSCNFSKIIDRAIFCFSACKRLKQHFCGVWAYKIRSFAIFASCIEKSLCTILRANICKLYPKVFLKESKPKSRKQRHKPHCQKRVVLLKTSISGAILEMRKGRCAREAR